MKPESRGMVRAKRPWLLGLAALLITALLAWMLGYTMGGGFRVSGTLGGTSHEKAASGLTGTVNSRATTGKAGGEPGTIEEQIARRQGKWTKERLETSIAAIGREPDIIHAARFTIKLTDLFGPEDFPLALTIMEGKKDELGDDAEIYCMLALARWADVDPKALGEYLRAQDKLGDRWFGPSEMELALGSWAAKDAPGAIAWVKSLKKKDQQEIGIKHILSSAARRDLDEAIAIARTHAPEFLKSDVFADAIAPKANHHEIERTARRLAEMGADATNISDAVRRWAKKDPAEAMQWAEGLADDKLRAEALKATWPKFAAAKPEEAAARLSKAAADAPFVENAARIVATALAKKDPQAAARWAAALPQPQARGEAHAELGEFYANKNPDKGAEWLDGLAPGDDRDKAVAAFVSRTKDKDPSAATDWAVTIRDDRKRLNAVRSALSDWFGKNPGAAVEWLQTTPSLSEQDREALLKPR